MINTSPVNFADSNPTDAETLGMALTFVCRDDGLCTYFPYPDSGPGTNLAQFIGQSSAGDWDVCVGDGAGGDVGILVSASVNITAGVLTINTLGLVLLVGLLGAGSLFVLRRKATIGWVSFETKGTRGRDASRALIFSAHPSVIHWSGI
jgi:hypothetical protein